MLFRSHPSLELTKKFAVTPELVRALLTTIFVDANKQVHLVLYKFTLAWAKSAQKQKDTYVSCVRMPHLRKIMAFHFFLGSKKRP